MEFKYGQDLDRERSAVGATSRRQGHRRRTWFHASLAFARAVSASPNAHATIRGNSPAQNGSP